MKRVIIFGYGQLGKELKYTSPSEIFLSIADRSTVDITNKRQIEHYIDEVTPDVVINASAYTNVDKAESEVAQAYEVNYRGPENLALICREKNIPILHYSTDYVFDGLKTSPYIETDKTGPLGVYGDSKLRGEKAIRQAIKHHIIIRTSWLYSSFGNNFVKTILRLGKEKSELSIVDDQIGCPTYARELAETTWKIIEQLDKKNWGTYHYCSINNASKFEFALKIINLAKANSTVYENLVISPASSTEYPMIARRPPNSSMKTDKIQAVFDLRISTWQKSLSRAIWLFTGNLN